MDTVDGVVDLSQESVLEPKVKPDSLADSTGSKGTTDMSGGAMAHSGKKAASATAGSTVATLLAAAASSAAATALTAKEQVKVRKPRLLVCAPSNVAVDNIISKIIEEGFKGGDGNKVKKKF